MGDMEKTVRLIVFFALFFTFLGGVLSELSAQDLPVSNNQEFAGGTGTSEDPFQVATAEHLDNVRNHLGAHFIQTGDIDLGVAPWNEGEGWEPIGPQQGTQFVGTFDGGEYVIRNVFINRSVDYNGLFGNVGSGGVIENVAVENVDISGALRTGGLAGWNSGEIRYSYSTGIVKSSGDRVGGLVGENQPGTVRDSYSQASVHGENYVGGLVGFNLSGATVNRSYSTGQVNARSIGGGLIGGNFANVSNSFWNTQTSGMSTSAGGTGLTSAEMRTISYFSDAEWDFDGVWQVVEPGSQSFPFFQINTQDPAPGLPSDNADLANLSLSDGTLSPEFNSNTTSYTTEDPLSTESITITPLAMDGGATIIVDGVSVNSGDSSDSIYLDVGNNEIEIVVTAETGVSNKTYTISITRLLNVPTITTSSPTSIGSESATLGGNVTDDGGATITERGVVYSTSPNPTTDDNVVQIGTGTGSFSQSVTGLSPGTSYFVRAYAINSEGTSYGTEQSFTTPVQIQSITRLDPASSLTNQDEVVFQVTFTGPVSGLSSDNFSLTESGLNGASLTSISGSGSTYDVTVHTGSGDGFVRLNAINDSNVTPPIQGLPYTDGEIYTIDKTPPTITSITSPEDPGPTLAQTLDITIEFPKPVYGFQFSDIQVSGDAEVSFSGTDFTDGETIYTFTATHAEDGELNLHIPEGTVQDEAGNLNSNTGSYSIQLIRNQPFAGGSGTEADPWQVTTADELNRIRNFLDGHFILTADIDLGGAPWNENEGWTPIGNSTDSFDGVLNGNGYTISNLYMDQNIEHVGLFGYIGEDAHVSNIRITNADIQSNQERIGILAGSLDGHVYEIEVSGTVSGNGRVGGLAGESGEHSTITKAVAFVNVISTSERAGGLLGVNSADVSHTYARGSVTGTNRVGGLIGNAFDGAVTNNYVSVELNGGSWVRGLVGDRRDNTAGTFSDNFVDEDVANTSNPGNGTFLTSDEMTRYKTFVDAGWNFDTIWGFNHEENDSYPFLKFQDQFTHNLRNSADLADLSVSGDIENISFDANTTDYELKVKNDVTSVDVSFSFADGSIGDIESPHTLHLTNGSGIFSVDVTAEDLMTTKTYTITFSPYFESGSGTEADPFAVATPEQLDYVRDFLDGHFIQTADIDLGVSPWSDGEGWEPISDHGNQFTGQFDGNGHYINNLKINRPAQTNVGLFGINNGKLLNITVEDAYVAGRSFVGVLVGNNYSNAIIDNSKSSGNVDAENTAGGLIGQNSGVIHHSGSSVDIKGRGSIGGLVGINGYDGAQIHNSFATGDVSGLFDSHFEPSSLGGLVGSNRGSVIRLSYATGSVTGSDGIGGLVGNNRDNGALIENTYSSGKVTAKEDEWGVGNIGGLVGSNRFNAHINQSYSVSVVNGVSGSGLVGRNDASVTNSYWDLEESGQSSSDGGTGLTTSELKSKPTFSNTGWDFDDIWQIDEPSSGSISYPYLQSNAQNPPPGLVAVELPTVITHSAIEQITSGSADVSGEVTDDGNLEISATGFVWATDDAPGDTTMIYSDNLTETITDLPPGTALNIRSFAMSDAGVAYSDPVSFETLQGELQIAGTFTAQDKIYDGDSTAEFDQNDLTLHGVYSGHEVSLTDIELQFSDPNAGDGLHVTLSSASLGGDDAGKYTLTLANAPTTTANVTPRELTIVADAQTAVYGEADPELTYEITEGSLVDGESLSGELSRTGDRDAGSYAIEQHTLTAGDNYDINFEPAAFEITPRELTITANPDQSKTYGAEDPQLTFEAENFGWGDDEELLTGSLSREAGESTGSYEILQGDLSAGENYLIYFVSADFDIVPSGLVVRAVDDQSKVYGQGDPDLQFTASGFGPGDDESVLSGSLSREPGEDAGTYQITQGDLNAGGDYSITFESSEFKIIPAVLTITADSDQSKIYGETDPDFGFSADGFVLGDDEMILTGDLAREDGQDAGEYEFLLGSLSAGGNYEIDFVSDSFSILPGTLTVVPDDNLKKIAGESDPDLTFTVQGWAFSDDESLLSGNLSRESGEEAGDYQIEPGTLRAGSNYEIDFTSGTFTILMSPPLADMKQPAEGKDRVAVDAPVVIGFNQDVNLKDTDGITISGPDGSTVPFSADISPNSLTLSHSGFENNLGYRVRIAEGTVENKDGIGNPEIEWSFSTIMTAPVVESFIPEQNAEGVETDSPVEISFDQNITDGGATAIELVSSDGQEVTLQVSSDENHLLIEFDALNHFTEYTLTLSPGAVLNEHGVGNEEITLTFTTMMAVPDPVVLLLPVNGDGAVSLNPKLTWEPSHRAEYYHLQVSDNEAFDDPVVNAANLTGTEYTPETELDDYTTYFWRVEARNETGESGWSEVASFVTLADVPQELFPVDRAVEVSTAPLLEWMSDYDTRFRVQLADTDNFENPLTDTLITSQSIQITSLNGAEDYYWRARVESEQTSSDWMTTQMFTTRAAPDDGVDGDPVVESRLDFGGTSNRENRQISRMDYRLVGLPGTDGYSVEQFFEGDYGTEWRAYLETGDDNDYYEEFESGDERFVFTPGRGFWVLSTDVIDMNLSVSSVPTNEMDAYSIEVHPGWNIIANPHSGPVSWSDVQELNDLTAEVFAYEQQFVSADSLHPVQGYYFYNDPDHLVSSLEIPYSAMDRRRSRDGGQAEKARKMVSLQAAPASAGITADFVNGLSLQTELIYEVSDEDQGRYLRPYPSLEMSRTGMMFTDDAIARGGLLRGESFYSEEGNEYALELKGEVGDVFTWQADLTGLGDRARVLLINPVTNLSWLLADGEQAEARISEPHMTYTVYVGDEEYLAGKQQDLMPDEITLKPNYPNPFNPTTNIRYAIPEQQHVRLEVYDVIGRRVQVLQDGMLQAGWHNTQFDARHLASGVYFYRLQVGEVMHVGRMTLIK